jgi:hypothetical protein
MHPKATVDRARQLSSQGLNDCEVARRVGVSVGAVQKWRTGTRRTPEKGMNRVRKVLADGDHWYEYPRYLFSNKSTDILGLCGAALDRLGVTWRFARSDVISVAKKEPVARLDEFVGPKY